MSKNTDSVSGTVWSKHFFFFCPSDVVGELKTVGVAECEKCRLLRRCPGFPRGSHTQNRLLGPWDGARGFPADLTPRTALCRMGASARWIPRLAERPLELWTPAAANFCVRLVWFQERSKVKALNHGPKERSENGHFSQRIVFYTSLVFSPTFSVQKS